MIDQTQLPRAEVRLETSDWREAVSWISALVVRGAPAIGIAGAAAVALAAAELAASEEGAEDASGFMARLSAAAQTIAQARPTAVNLAWAVDLVMRQARARAEEGASSAAVVSGLFDDVDALIAQDEEVNRRIGSHGAALLPEGARILTHCNAGSLATAFYGTALGVVYAAFEEGKVARVFADETRPVCQGARLTAWELSRVGVPVTLICDDMAATVMDAGEVDAVIVGADRIAANGDAANKIGTLGVAVLARHFNVPFYVAAPTSTVDLGILDGSRIPIEERDAAEVLEPPIEGVDVLNPAFDVTPASLITAIITERGVFRPDEIASSVS